MLLGVFVGAPVLFGQGDLTAVELLAASIWTYANLGLLVWSPPLCGLLELVTLGTTPPVRDVLVGRTQHPQGGRTPWTG